MPDTPGPLAYLNGRFLAQAEAAIPLHDAGFIMGATVTDLCRTFQQKLYRWPDHLARLEQSCRLAQIEPPLSGAVTSERAEELVRHNAALLPPGTELALVLFATPGPVGYYLGEEGGLGDSPATFGMHTFPLPFARYRRWIEEGAALVVPSIRQLPPECVDPHIKMRSRIHYWLAYREVQALERGAAALLLDSEGHVTETAAANLLIVQDGKVISPPRERILDGISLRVVTELCKKLGIELEERLLTIQDVKNAQEALLASTPYCLVGVSRCNGAALPWPGEIYRRLVNAWSEEVGIDIREQILQTLV